MEEVVNKKRRKEINKLMDKLSELKEHADTLMTQEQDYFDNMPSNLQDSDKGIESAGFISNLEAVVEGIDQAVNNLEEIINT